MKKRIIPVFCAVLSLFFSSACSFSLYAQNQKPAKKVVLIIGAKDFRDEELFQTQDILEQNGVKVFVASSSRQPSQGMFGGEAVPDMLIGEIDPANFDAVIFIGGKGAMEYWDDPVAHKLAKETIEQNKILGAICLAPVTLARAGVLKGKRATVWSTQGADLQSGGAKYTGTKVEMDGSIITADGPFSVLAFSEEILKALNNN
ncbi:MAG: DJ-1/PfpI family protein [Candidatus Omnitrophica bacterium]|nr:DJ-1/PfpI family protein [Candidatus Omnitrophota bacterium]